MPKTRKAKKPDESEEQSEEQSESEPRESADEDVALTRLRRRRSTSNSTPKQTMPEKRTTRSATKNKLGSPPTDTSALYCFCRKPFDNRFMIQCEKCLEWYHGDCVGISLRQGKQMEKQNESYYCLACKEIGAPDKDNKEESDAGDEDESISLAAIRKQAKPSDETQATDQKNEAVVSNEAGESSSHSPRSSDLVDNAKMVVDFSTLLAAERLLASDTKDEPDISAPVESPSIDDDEEDEQDDTEVVKEEVEAKEEKKVRPRKRQPSTEPEAAKESSSVTNTSSSSVPPAQPKKTKDSSQDRCFVGNCQNRQMPGSIYCSQDCLHAHCTQSIDLLRLAQARLPGKSSSDPKPTELRLSVIDSKCGRLINEHKLVNENTIEKFITKHPTFRIVTPQATPSMLVPQQPAILVSASAAVASAASSPGVVNAFRMTVRQELRDALKLRSESADDFIVSAGEINRTALLVEEAMFKQLGGSQSDKYKQRFRCLILNIKDQKNKGLFRRVLLGTLSPEEVATAPAERLASEELVQWREQQRKKSLEMLIAGETQPVLPELPATSKPPATSASGTTLVSNPPTSTHPTLTHNDLLTLDESFRIDTTANHRSHLFDVNCKLCTGKSEKVEPPRHPPPTNTPAQSRLLPSAYGALANETYANASSVPIQISVRQPTAPSSAPPTRAPEPVTTLSSSTVTTSAVPTKPILSSMTAPVVRQEKSPNSPSTRSSISPPRPQLDVEWFGQLKPDVTAPSVPLSGRLISVTPLIHLENFPEILDVIGKLSTPAVWDYLDKIRRSNNKEIVIVLMEPTKAAESILHYRTTLASLKERNRYAVVRTVTAQVAGCFKDIYLTYTNTEWLRRLNSFGIRFTEQLPLESKLACILVRYLTAPVSVPPPPQTTSAPTVNVIPLDKKASSTPTQKEADTPRLDAETPIGEEEDEEYDPGFSIFPIKSETPKVTEQPSYIPMVKPVQQPPTSTAADKKPEPEKKPDEKKPIPGILSTPEEVSSVSELIKRILGSSAATVAPTTSSTTSNTVTATTTTASLVAQPPKIEPVVTSSGQNEAPAPLLPPFPPPPPGFMPPPFPGPPFPGPPLSLPHFPSNTDNHGSIPPPICPPPPNVMNQQPFPPFMPPMAQPAMPPPPSVVPPFPPPPMFIPAPSANAAPPMTVDPFPNRPFPPDSKMRLVNEAEPQIYRYLNQLLDETLSLATRTTLLQELAVLLQNPENEEIVRQNPELTERFQKAVAIVNAVVDRNRPHCFGENYDEQDRFPRKTLLPTPNCPPLLPLRQPSPSEEDFIRPNQFPGIRPAQSSGFDKSPVPPGMNNYRPFQPTPEIPPSLIRPPFRTKMSSWRCLLRAFHDRLKPSSSLPSTKGSDSSKSISTKASRSSESSASVGHRTKRNYDGEEERPRRSRWDAEEHQQDQQSTFKRGRHGSDSRSGPRRHSYADDDGVGNTKRSRPPRIEGGRGSADYQESRQGRNNGRSSAEDSFNKSAVGYNQEEKSSSSQASRKRTEDRNQPIDHGDEKRPSCWKNEFPTAKSNSPQATELGPPVVPLTITMPPKSSVVEGRREEPSPRKISPSEGPRFPGPEPHLPGNSMEQPPWRPKRQDPMHDSSYRPEPPPFPMFPASGPFNPTFRHPVEAFVSRGNPFRPLTRTINNDGRGRGGRGRSNAWGPPRGGLPPPGFVPRGGYFPPRAEFGGYPPPPFGPRY